MNRYHRYSNRLLLPVLIAAIVLCGGCAYYNTFYNAKNKFNEAERETIQSERQRAQTSTTQGTQSSTQGTAQLRPVPMDKYRKVIETCSKLLEFYPKSRWVDDALFLMGVSYYRINDLARAERKFTELTTLFPKSPHVPVAIIWKARTLAEQKMPDKAIELLETGLNRLKSGPQRAEALFQLARLYFQLEQWSNAAARYEECLHEKQPREKRSTALYEYGLSQYHVGAYAEARTAFSETARASTNVRQAYDAFIHWARCEIVVKNFGEAEGILLRLRASERFLDFRDDTDLELADLAVQNGRYEDAIGMYERYVANHDNGEKRGLAFYRLAGIYHENLVDLTVSKALLDSAVRVGAAKVIADSARVTLDQISKGLLALQEIGGLMEQIRALEGDTNRQPSAPVQPSPPAQPSPPPAGSENIQREEVPFQTADSTEKRNANTTAMNPARTDTSQEAAPFSAADSSEQASADTTTMNPARADTSAEKAQHLSPAAAAADSILNALRLGTSQKTKTDSVGSDSIPPHRSDQSSQRGGIGQLTGLRRELQVAYLHIAEFYEFTLADHDSGLYYYRLAAADPVNPAVYWRANLFLAHAASGPGDSLTPEAEPYYRAVLNADSVPLPAENAVRNVLGMPLREIPLPPQLAALRAAEVVQDDDSVSTDSLMFLYSKVIEMDSASVEAQVALFAKANLFEDTLRQQDSVRKIYQELIRLHPDASYVLTLKKRLKPPDSLSVFLISDEQLFGGSQAVAETIFQPAQDKSGWPPAEETLRGRRFR